MNSPVPCLPDPIQNMVKNKNSKNKSKQQKKVPKQKKAPGFLRTVQAPASYGMVRGAKNKLPILASESGRCIVKNFELMTPFGTPGADFNIAGYYMNPGIAVSFPWCSAIAAGYQKFRFLFLRAFYSSTCSTSCTGQAYIQMQYDSIDTTPTTLAQVMAGDSSSLGPVWFGGAVNGDKGFDTSINPDSNIFVDLDTNKLSSEWYYVRTTATQSSGGALTGAPTGGIGTLAFTQGTVLDEQAVPIKLLFGSQASLNASGARISPGQLYLAYIIEFAEPVAQALAV